jgi:O-succinylbenzoate synthase
VPARRVELTEWPALTAVELFRIEMPLRRAHAYAGGVEETRRLVLVRAIAMDGVEGWGECSALATAGYTAETIDASWRGLRDSLAPAWLEGRPPAAVAPMAYAAIETAAIDVELRRRGNSLASAWARALGEPTHPIEWSAVMGLHASEPQVDDALQAGARLVKFKVTPESDLTTIVAVRRAHPDVALAVDANGSFMSADAVPDRLGELGLTYIEQPVGPHDLHASATVAQRLDVAVALDESITSATALAAAADAGACSIVNVKVGRVGGLAETGRVLAAARRLGIDAFAGGMLESGVGRAVALAVGGQGVCTRPCDAGPTGRYFTRDIVDAFEPDADGRLVAPDGPGIGVAPNMETIATFCVERVTLRP